MPGSGQTLFLLPLFYSLKILILGPLKFLVEPHLFDAEFRKAWMPFFCRFGHPVVTVDQFLSFVGSFLFQEAELHLPPISGRDLQEVARAKKSTFWRLSDLLLPWFSRRLSFIFRLISGRDLY